MHPAFDDLEATQGDRYRCPLCDARRGVSVDPDEGETGLWHCFSCQEGGTGAELYAQMRNVPLSEALSAFGISQSDLEQDVQQREDTAPRPEVTHSDAEWRRRTRSWKQMTTRELEKLDHLKRQRWAAKRDRQSKHFWMWQGKIDGLFDTVEKRMTQEVREDEEAKAKWTFERSRPDS